MKKLLMLLTICLALLCLCLPALAEVEIEIVDANYIRLSGEIQQTYTIASATRISGRL